MRKQLYSLDDEKRPVMNISWPAYNRVMFEIRTDNVYMNPFLHLIRGEYTFIHNDKTIAVAIGIRKGIGTIVVMDGDNRLINYRIKDLYKLYKIQIEYWNIFNVPMVFHLMELGLLSDDNLCEYRSILFYPPNVVGRMEWDVMEIRENYYIHNVAENRWCLYHWVSGENERSMDIYIDGDDIDDIKRQFNVILVNMGVKDDDKTTRWSSVTHNEDGSYTLTQCG